MMNDAPPVAEDDLGAQFTQALNGLVTEVLGNPVIDQGALGASVGLAHLIGNGDGTVGARPPYYQMPHEKLIAGCMAAPSAGVGKAVGVALQDVRQGKLITDTAPEAQPSGWVRFTNFLKRHALLLIALVILVVIEFLIGEVWSQRVFGFSDNGAKVYAGSFPILFASIGFIVASSFAQNARSRVKLAVVVLAALAVLCYIGMFILAGLILSDVVSSPLTTGGGFTGGASGTTAESGSSGSYDQVKFGVYVLLNLGAFLGVMAAHMHDVEKSKRADNSRKARAQMNALDADEIRESNRSALTQFLSIGDELQGLRDQIMNSYRAGVLETIAPDIPWAAEALGKAWTEPKWVVELKDEIEKLAP